MTVAPLGKISVLALSGAIMFATPAVGSEPRPIRIETRSDGPLAFTTASSAKTTTKRTGVTTRASVPEPAAPLHTVAAPVVTGASAAPVMRKRGVAALATKLERIATLKDGWFGPTSKAISPESVSLVRSMLPTIAGSSHKVTIAPHEDGVLVLEWADGSVEYTVELLHNGRMVLTTDDEDHDIYDELELDADAFALRRFIEGATA